MKKILILLMPILLLTSCVTNKLISKSVSATEIKESAYFEPLSFISLIEKANKSVPSDSLSLVSKILLDSIIQNNPSFKVSKKIEITNPKVKNKVDIELSNLITGIIRSLRFN